MPENIGLMFIGLGGAIGSTVAAGVESMRNGLSPALGMLTETGLMPAVGPQDSAQGRPPLIRDALELPRLEHLRFSGWDLRPDSVYDAAKRERIVPEKMVDALQKQLSEVKPLGGIVFKEGAARRIGSEEATYSNLRAAADAIRSDIQAFRKSAGVSRVVIVDLSPTRPLPSESPAHKSLDKFEAALQGLDASITSNMLYMYAALMEGCPFVNFTPNVVEVEAMRELAAKMRVPFAGRDGKTGQTFIKTVLAPGFRERQLHVRGWYSANILGNEDGKALSNPRACETKILSKASVLDNMLGYPVVGENGESSHVVSILYYPPRGDEKEAWDSIDLEGFLGQKMQMKVNFLCKDSILAAPLVVDLARMADWGHRQGDHGVLEYLSMYFKSPHPDSHGNIVHDFFRQVDMFHRRLLRRSQA